MLALSAQFVQGLQIPKACNAGSWLATGWAHETGVKTVLGVNGQATWHRLP